MAILAEKEETVTKSKLMEYLLLSGWEWTIASDHYVYLSKGDFKWCLPRDYTVSTIIDMLIRRGDK